MERHYVRAVYKTGVYLAELLEEQPDHQRALVKVAAVLKHPMQGDLHQPKEADVPLFHQRKALAEFEKTWVPLSSMKPYEGEIPSYQESLKAAFEKELANCQQLDSEWARKCEEKLKECAKEYGW
ncbi:kinase-associated lipoprotein B [Alkalihalobacillus oceani]|uniref:kinase-associated lipoprotein B n=1 Tax=Halalkalibacter oceani TaxID=1653776 RepID=UPI00203BCF23|nr:kinase-associated lipoprotein B [Halalkalibacter oceani]